MVANNIVSYGRIASHQSIRFHHHGVGGYLCSKLISSKITHLESFISLNFLRLLSLNLSHGIRKLVVFIILRSHFTCTCTGYKIGLELIYWSNTPTISHNTGPTLEIFIRFLCFGGCIFSLVLLSFSVPA